MWRLSILFSSIDHTIPEYAAASESFHVKRRGVALFPDASAHFHFVWLERGRLSASDTAVWIGNVTLHLLFLLVQLRVGLMDDSVHMAILLVVLVCQGLDVVLLNLAVIVISAKPK